MPRAQRPTTIKAADTTRFVFPILAAAGVYFSVMQTVMLPLLPTMPEATHSTPATVSWLITATLLVGTVVTPIFGRLADMYGKKPVLLLVFALMAVGSLICMVSNNIGVLIAARAVQGVGAAVVPIGISLIREVMPREKVGKSVALLTGTLGAGAALGVPFAAVLAQFFSWHILFAVTTVLGAVVTAAAAFIIPKGKPAPGGRFDFLGATGLTVGLLALLIPITQGSTWGWTSLPVAGIGTAAFVILGLWAWQQARSSHALLDIRLATSKGILVPHILALLVGFAFYGNVLISTQLLQAPKGPGLPGYGFVIIAAALCQLPQSFANMLLPQVGLRFTRKYSARAVMWLGGAFLVLGYAGHVVPGKPAWLVIGCIILAAIGTGFVYSTLPLLLLPVVPAGQVAEANGVSALLRSLGTTFCSAAAATVLAATSASAGGFSAAYAICLVVSAGLIAASFALPGHRAQQGMTTRTVVRGTAPQPARRAA
jgi:MFS family permease